MKKKKIKIKKLQQKNKTQSQTNLEKFVLRKRLVDKNGWQHYVYHQADTTVLHSIPTITMSENDWNRGNNDFATKIQVQGAVQLIIFSVARYLFHVLQENNFKDPSNNTSK